MSSSELGGRGVRADSGEDKRGFLIGGKGSLVLLPGARPFEADKLARVDRVIRVDDEVDTQGDDAGLTVMRGTALDRSSSESGTEDSLRLWDALLD